MKIFRESSLTSTGTGSRSFTADFNGQRQNICMPQRYRKVPIIIIIPSGRCWTPPCWGQCLEADPTLPSPLTASSTHAELLPDSWHISIKFSATCSCVQEMEQIAVWFSSCSCGLTAVGTVSSWFKASPGMCTWPAVGELTGNHDLLPAPDYTASRSPWALSWFTSVFSPKLPIFFLS